MSSKESLSPFPESSKGTNSSTKQPARSTTQAESNLATELSASLKAANSANNQPAGFTFQSESNLFAESSKTSVKNDTKSFSTNTNKETPKFSFGNLHDSIPSSDSNFDSNPLEPSVAVEVNYVPPTTQSSRSAHDPGLKDPSGVVLEMKSNVPQRKSLSPNPSTNRSLSPRKIYAPPPVHTTDFNVLFPHGPFQPSPFNHLRSGTEEPFSKFSPSLPPLDVLFDNLISLLPGTDIKPHIPQLITYIRDFSSGDIAPSNEAEANILASLESFIIHLVSLEIPTPPKKKNFQPAWK